MKTDSEKIDLPSLSYRRLRGDMIEIFKFLHGIYKIDCSSFLPRDSRLHIMNIRGHDLRLEKRECRARIRGNVLGFRAVNLWNMLPPEIVHSATVNCFKGRLDRYCSELKYRTDIDQRMMDGREQLEDQSTGHQAYNRLSMMMMMMNKTM